MRDEADAAYRKQLEDLAAWCKEHGLARESGLAARWLPRRDPLKTYIFKLPDSLDEGRDRQREAPTADVFWKRFAALRLAQADALFDHAARAHASGRYAEAYDLVREACRENPSHSKAREILGYVRYGDGWALPDTARRLAAGQIYHAQFGWLPRERVEPYEHGRRYVNGRWLTAAEEERQRASIKNGWRIDSEHYRVTTNHSLEEGVQLSRRLEKLYDVWRHVFVDYYTPQSEMDRWFARAPSAGSGPPAPASVTVVRRQHQVVHFRNRDEYIAALRGMQPQIDITLGIYFARTRSAYFFAGDNQYEGTLLHEAAHQLFQETQQTGRDVGARSNFAIVEAIACHLESLVEEEHWFTVGGMDAGRAPAARERLIEHRFYVPFAELTSLGMNELQRDARLAKIYSQISGQALFLLHANGGRYRRPLIETLVAIYNNKADAGTLAKSCGRSYEQLDKEYHDFMQAAGDQ